MGEFVNYSVTSANAVAGLVTDSTSVNQWTGLCGSEGLTGAPCTPTVTTTSYQFRTQDDTPPTITTTSPLVFSCDTTSPNANNVNIAGDQTITIVLSEPTSMGSATVPVTFKPKESTSSTATINGVFALTGDHSTVTLQPESTLHSDTWYDVIIPSCTVADAAGNCNPYVGSGQLCFQVLDTTAPTIAGFQPLDRADDVIKQPQITLTFSEPVQRGSAGVITVLPMNTTDLASPMAHTWDVSDTTNVLVNGPTVTLHPPDTSLGTQTWHWMAIDEGAFQDAAPTPNPYPGLILGVPGATESHCTMVVDGTAYTQWCSAAGECIPDGQDCARNTYCFETLDYTPPSLEATVPYVGQSNVSNKDFTMVLTFSEQVR